MFCIIIVGQIVELNTSAKPTSLNSMAICSRGEKEEIGRCCSNLFHLHENFYPEELKSVSTVYFNYQRIVAVFLL